MSTRTYLPILKWRCTRCGKSGEVAENLNSVLLTWEAVVEAHHKVTPECGYSGDGGIAVEQERVSLPE